MWGGWVLPCLSKALLGFSQATSLVPCFFHVTHEVVFLYNLLQKGLSNSKMQQRWWMLIEDHETSPVLICSLIFSRKAFGSLKGKCNSAFLLMGQINAVRIAFLHESIYITVYFQPISFPVKLTSIFVAGKWVWSLRVCDLFLTDEVKVEVQLSACSLIAFGRKRSVKILLCL